MCPKPRQAENAKSQHRPEILKFIQRLKIFKTQGTTHRTVPCVFAENGRKSFYLHEIVIKNKDASPFMAEQQKTVSAGKASFDTTVPQKAQSVNTSISENAENDTKNIAPVKNSLSEQGKQPSFVGTPLKDLYYGDDIAPVKDAAKPKRNMMKSLL